MAYIKGSERRQNILFPSTLDEYVDEANAVRVIAAFVGALDFLELGFVRGEAADTGRPGYDPRGPDEGIIVALRARSRDRRGGARAATRRAGNSGS